MAQSLAPYNNSMRLGQGFNSYTQQVCLDQAVLPNNSVNRTRLAEKLQSRSGGAPPPGSTSRELINSLESYDGSQESDELDPDDPDDPDYREEQRKGVLSGSGSADNPVQVQPWVKPQIVTYSSRFVDKLSDVTDAMNISGSLSIKTATIGGKASGSYVDSDKFKSSDINFHLQVKVTNQILDGPEYLIFNKINNVKKDEFTSVYGDTFISGWEEGGELNAIISMKVFDKDKIFEIKAELEAELTTPSLAGKVSGKFEKTKKELAKNTETTITVNWAGGGSIKHPAEDWSIASLKKAAAAFPDLVAITPQRTYAILTKYTSLASFHIQKEEFSPLEYENAGIYTGALLDAYMDYKAMWKQISHATYELEQNRATIEMAEPSEDIYALATVKKLPEDKPASQQNSTAATSSVDGRKTIEGMPNSNEQFRGSDRQLALSAAEVQAPSTQHNAANHQFTVFRPSFAGLIAAKKVCRFEMAKIVNEVDLIAKTPSLSTDITRDAYFLNPLVFKQLLPVVRTLSPEFASRGLKDPSAALLIGFVQPKTTRRKLPNIHKLAVPLSSYDDKLQALFTKNAHKAEDYRMQGCAGITKNIHSQAKVFSSVTNLDATYRPTRISVWHDGVVKGIRFEYANGIHQDQGACAGEASHVLSLARDGSEIITEVSVAEVKPADKPISIIGISIATSHCNILDVSTIHPQGQQSNSSTITDPITTHKWTRPDESQWSIRSVFGFSQNDSITTLGTVWGKDTFVPVTLAGVTSPLCDNLLCLCLPLREQVKSFFHSPGFPSYADKMFMSKSAGSPARKPATTASTAYFNALNVIDVPWRIKSIAFAAVDGRLTGLRVWYHHGDVITHGTYTDESKVWAPDVKSDLAVVKITAGKRSADEEGSIDTLEFIRATQEGVDGESNSVPAWPLDVSTMRYLGQGDTRVSVDVDTVVEKAPTTGGFAWSIRGFYGEICEQGWISRLGVVWGRS